MGEARERIAALEAKVKALLADAHAAREDHEEWRLAATRELGARGARIDRLAAEVAYLRALRDAWLADLPSPKPPGGIDP